MNTSGDASEQLMRMMLNGTEVLVKLTGTGAKNVAVLLYSIARQQEKTKGAARLSSMLRSGKPLKVYTFKDKDLEQFKKCAKQYGILYTILKEKDRTGGVFDVMVRAEDESKIARIIERFNLSRVNTADLRTEIIREQQQNQNKGQNPEERVETDEATPPETEHPTRTADEILADEILDKPLGREEPAPQNPTAARTETSGQGRPSEHSSMPVHDAGSDRAEEGRADTRSEGRAERRAERRPSVRERLETIKRERRDRERTRTHAPDRSRTAVPQRKER